MIKLVLNIIYPAIETSTLIYLFIFNYQKILDVFLKFKKELYLFNYYLLIIN